MGREIEDVAVAGGGHGFASLVGRFSAHDACWGILSGRCGGDVAFPGACLTIARRFATAQWAGREAA